jgi:MFS family permease
MVDQPAEAVAAAPRSGAMPDRTYANYALAVLFVVMLLNFLDRQIIAILAEPIKQDLGLTDTQVGLMSGFSFALFYTTLGVPIALLADRWHRPRIIAISLALWSGMTVLCGMAQNFVQMFLARVGVGVGEAGSGPASHALLASIFPPEKRAGALGVYGMAVPLGALIAYAGGAAIVQAFGWRMAFVIAGLPGLIMALIVAFTIREPRGVTPLREALRPVPGALKFKDAFGELARKPTYWHLIAAGVLVQFVAYGFASFYGGYFVRVHQVGLPGGEWDFRTMGIALGVMIGISGAFGAWSGGAVADRVRARGVGWTLVLPALTMFAATPLFIWGLYQADPLWAVILFAAPTIAGTFYYGPTFAAVQSLARDETRAVAVSVYLLISGLFGMGLGPLVVGTLSDMFAAQPGAAPGPALVQALVILAMFNLWGGVHFLFAARGLARDSA